MFAAQFLNAPELSACLAPSGCRYQPFERAVMQSHGVTLAFHGEPQDAARQLVRLHRGITLRRKPSPTASASEDRRSCCGTLAWPVLNRFIRIRTYWVILESFGAKLAEFVTWGGQFG